MSKETNIISGFVLGAITGVAIGVLFAPSSGKRTRRKIKKETGRLVTDARDSLTNAADDAALKVNEGIQDLSHKGAESIAKLREKLVK